MVTKAQKVQKVEDLKAVLASSQLAIVSDYQGTNVSEITTLRRGIQAAGGDFSIAKNTLIKRVIAENESLKELESFLVGPTALAYTKDGGDPVKMAKFMMDYIRTAKKTEIKGGVFQGKMIKEADIKAIASLPSKEVLISKLLGSMNAPAQGMAMVLSGVSRNLVYVLDAIRKQKEANQ